MALVKVATLSKNYAAPVEDGLRFDYSAMNEDHRKPARAAAVEINAHVGRMKESALTIGKRLSTVKDLLPHGQFLAWVEAEFPFSEQTARNFMNVYQRFENRPDALDLFEPTALYLLASPSTPESIVKKAIKIAAKSGEKMSGNDAKNLVKNAKKCIDLHEKTPTVGDLKPVTIEANYTVVAPPIADEKATMIALIQATDWHKYDVAELAKIVAIIRAAKEANS